MMQNRHLQTAFLCLFLVGGLAWTPISAQSSCTCENATQFPSSIANVNQLGGVTPISTCNYAGEYAEIGLIEAGNTYEFTSDAPGDYLTVRVGSSDGPVLECGATPVVVETTSDDNLYLHINTDESCGDESECRETTVECLTCGDICETEVELTQTHCYSNNDPTTFSYVSADGSSPMTLTFTAGDIEFTYDFIAIYDGPDNNAPVLFDGDNGGDLTGLSVTSTGTSLFMEIDADGSVSCQSSFSYESWAWTVCNGAVFVPEPPANDLCGSAEPIACGDVVNGNTGDATTTGAPTGCSGIIDTAPGVWYVLEGDGSDVTASLCGSSYDTKLAVLSGSCGQLACDAYNDDECSLQSEIEFTTTAGTDYYIYVSGFGSSTGNYTLTLTCTDPPPPPVSNFTCNEAIPAVVGMNETEVINSGNGAVNGCTFPVSATADHARWFTFVPTVNGEYTIGSSGFTSADTRLSIYTGGCSGLSCFASNDDVNGLADLASEVTACLQAGATYYIEWDNAASIASFDWEIAYNGIGDCGAGGDLPAPWTANDVGNDGPGNDYGFEDGTFTITGGGRNGYSGTGDNIAFASQTLCGDGMITARVESVSPGGYGGVALRESTAPGAKQVLVLSNQTSLVPFVTRSADNAPNSFTPHWKPFAFWLRIVRTGNYIRGYYSTTGNSFTIVSAAYIEMDECVEVGMFAANILRNNQVTATFSNVSVVGSGPALLSDNTDVVNGAATKAQSATDAPGLKELGSAPAAEARLFPNPATHRVTIGLDAALPVEATLTLRNQLGQALESRQVEAGLFQTDWDISQLSGGVYYMEVRYEGQEPQVLRFVKAQ